MKEIRTEDAVGHILCHDITQIIKDVKKGVLFKKGHIVREEDIPLLLSVGKEHLYVWEKKEGILHENEGAEILYKICAGDSDTMHADLLLAISVRLTRADFRTFSWEMRKEASILCREVESVGKRMVYNHKYGEYSTEEFPIFSI